jgi:hypothetical protein
VGKLIGMLNLGEEVSSWPSWCEANRAFQREYFEQVLTAANGNQLLAAALLGIHRNTVGRLGRQLGVDAQSFRSKARPVYRLGGPVTAVAPDPITESPGRVVRMLNAAERGSRGTP